MRRIYLIAAALPILAPARRRKTTPKQISSCSVRESAAMGPAVKGAPYSAEEVTESTAGSGRRHSHS